MRIRELRHNLWNIGFVEEGLEEVLTTEKLNIRWAKKRIKDRWFADPYILDVTDDEIIILAEEYCYDVRRGRLARVTFDRHTYEEKHFSIILDLPTHLSFPFIYRKEGKVYILPENSASNSSTIYEFNDSRQTLTPIGKVADLPLTDTTLFVMNGQHFLWSTMLPEPNGNMLSIFEFDNNSFKIGKLLSTADFPKNTARNAGECFYVDAQLYRPAQDCTACYGNGVVLQKVECVNGQWKFTDVNSFYPQSFWLNQGIHTFNHYKDLIVVDGRGYRYPILGRIVNTFLNIIRS